MANEYEDIIRFIVWRERCSIPFRLIKQVVTGVVVSVSNKSLDVKGGDDGKSTFVPCWRFAGNRANYRVNKVNEKL